MSAFTAEWLALREAYDARARNSAIRNAAVASLSGHPSVTIVDLGCGTGATLRALAPQLTVRQNWRLVDNDLGLLARAAANVPARVNATPMPVDLNRDLEAALDGPVDLVTASALLDLVSRNWLERLVVEIAVRKIPFYAALIYDGRIEFEPVDPADAAIVAALNQHQRTDKGFGPALGPTSAICAVERFKAAGFAVDHGLADWVLGPDDREMQNEVLAGWAAASRELGELSFAEVAGWLTRRREAVASGRSLIRVGHVDLFARPNGMR